MWEFYILGSSGGKAKERWTMCIYLPPNILIDAGNAFSLEKPEEIEHVFISHSHLDHVVDISFLIDYSFPIRNKPLKVYGLKETIETLRKHIFNWNVWPDFGYIKLENSHENAIEYIIVKPEEEIEIEGYKITPVKSVHTVPTVGYIVKKENKGFFYTADTFKNKRIWEILNADKEIKILLIDVSFPSRMRSIAEASLHNTPETLFEDMENLDRDDLKIYAIHLKPFFEREIIKELGDKVEAITDFRKIEVK